MGVSQKSAFTLNKKVMLREKMRGSVGARKLMKTNEVLQADALATAYPMARR